MSFVLPQLALASGTAPSDTTLYVLPPVVVQATKPAATPGGATVIEVSLDSLGVASGAPLEDVLRKLPMLHVRRNSRGEAEISARGSESRQVAVLVDGVPLTLAWDGRADLSIIPSTAIQHLDYTRGLSSMLYGPNVLGGIVEARVGSVSHRNTRLTEITAGLQHTGGNTATVATSQPFETGRGSWLLRAGMGYRDLPGQPLARGVSEPQGGWGDLRLNTDVQSRDGFVSLGHRTSAGGWFSLFGSTFQAERGIAAELGVDEARFWRYPNIRRSLLVAAAGSGHRASPLGGWGAAGVSVALDRGRTDIDSYTSRAYEQVDDFEDGEDRTITLRMTADHSLGERAQLQSAFTLANIRHKKLVPEGVYQYRQRLWSLGTEATWWPVKRMHFVRDLRLSIGAAYDVADTPAAGGREPLGQLSNWGGRAGFSMGLFGGHTLLHGGLSHRARFPALRELYSGAINRFVPNPELQPEKLLALEAGTTVRFGSTALQATGFYHRLNDAVVRITVEDRRFKRVNRNQLRSAGIELALSKNLGRMHIGADLTLQKVHLTDTQSRKTHRPENLPEVYGSVNAAFPLNFGLRGYSEVSYTGRQFCIDPGTGSDAKLDAGAIFSTSVSRFWTTNSLLSLLETRLSVENLTDKALYDQCGLPQPGRRLSLELRIHYF